MASPTTFPPIPAVNAATDLPSPRTTSFPPLIVNKTSAKLGDFSTLRLFSDSFEAKDNSSLENNDSSCPSTTESFSAIKPSPALGNFSRVFTHLGRAPTNSASLDQSPDTIKVSPKMDHNVPLIFPAHLPMPLCGYVPSAQCVPDYVTLFNQRYRQAMSIQAEASGTSSEPISDAETEASHIITPTTSLSSPPSPDTLKVQQSKTILVYQIYPNGPHFKVTEDSLPSEITNGDTKALNSILHNDDLVRDQYPSVVKNGIHVFLDMSNIHISFLQTVKESLGLPATARCTPNPSFDIAFLTDLVVRGRRVKTLRAGCSVHPDRGEPCFIDTLRKLDYQIDVRERKATQEPRNGGQGNNHGPNPVRYVEDLVDETLQTRIGEAFMRSPKKKGTLVLVTGDAQPAKYSDGFYIYATRALKWGWNVEVICWKISCSSLWRDLAYSERASRQFRLIELDSGLRGLWDRKA